jgi:hypothetical protein
MKNILLLLLTMLMLASCKKSDTSPSSPIVGEWTLQAGQQTTIFKDGSSTSRAIKSTPKANFGADGSLTNGLLEFTNYNSSRYAYNATTSKLSVGTGANPWIFDVVALTSNNLQLAIVTPPTPNGEINKYFYNYTK